MGSEVALISRRGPHCWSPRLGDAWDGDRVQARLQVPGMQDRPPPEVERIVGSAETRTKHAAKTARHLQCARAHNSPIGLTILVSP
jgi:hypothetical protein